MLANKLPHLRPEGHLMRDRALMVGFDIAGYDGDHDLEALEDIHTRLYTAAERAGQEASVPYGEHVTLERGGTGVLILPDDVQADTAVNRVLPALVQHVSLPGRHGDSGFSLNMRAFVHRGPIIQQIHRTVDGAVVPDWGWLGRDLTQVFRVLTSQEYRQYHKAHEGLGVLALSTTFAAELPDLPAGAQLLNINCKETSVQVYAAPLGA